MKSIKTTAFSVAVWMGLVVAAAAQNAPMQPRFVVDSLDPLSSAANVQTMSEQQRRSRATEQAQRARPHDPAAAVLTDTARRNIDDLRQALKQSARMHIENQTRNATGGRATVSSRDRDSGRLRSAGHDRGAVDFGFPRGTNLNQQGRAIAKRVGPYNTVVVEHYGRPKDTHTTYKIDPRTGKMIKKGPYEVDGRATGDHIHVEPKYGIRPWAKGQRITPPPSTTGPPTTERSGAPQTTPGFCLGNRCGCSPVLCQ